MKDTQEWMQKLREGQCAQSLAALYGSDAGKMEEQSLRYQRALEGYEELFGAGEVELYSAPGRTEIGGNHTDHQHGRVLAASINLDTIAVVGRSDNNMIEVVSEGYAPVRIDLANLSVRKEAYGTTEALLCGVVAGMQQRGYRTGPFRAYVTSNVLSGAGLSSSAAFETLIGIILSGLYHDMAVAPEEIAMIGQYAENVYFGKPCGLMDQMASSVGGIVYLDFANPQKPVVEKVEYDITDKGYRLCIVDTKGSHADLTADYAAIPAEMKAVAGLFGCQVLGDVRAEEFYKRLPELYGKTSNRSLLRAMHFFQENERVQKEAAALRADDFPRFLELVAESGDSSYKYLQNIYSSRDVENQPIALALALSEHILGKNGVSRVHGGGFAGTVQAFVKSEFVPEYKREMEAVFGMDSCHVLTIRKYGGIRIGEKE